MAERDPMTGLMNYQALRRLVSEHLDERAQVVMLDVRGMMRLNYDYGADRVDEMLVVLAQALRALCDAQTDVVRMGGDHFMVIRRSDDASGLIRRVSDLASTVRDPALRPLRYSTAEVAGPLNDELLRAADKALWEAKASL